ncbi:MAG: PFL family protein [Clostridium sp.]|uniref:PFL family protein n=1 Tax=Clostridium sp. TaxID=1506 RepID=UPI001DDE89C3|nr:PFL family protein [Clostridium sp.]MBS4804158.1 PFL family protein [Clostridium sp.]MBS5937204.1 PFL family protein [Clostridium sp.]
MNSNNILETIKMIEEEKLDIRTITMGISLLDCIDSDGDKAREKIYNKIVSSAKDLVKVGKEIENEFGIPIVNKRVSVTPISIIAGATDEENYVKFAETLDKAAETLGVDFIGGFSALVQKGYTKGDKILIESIPEALAKTSKVCSSVNVGSSRSGINMDAVRHMGEIIKRTAENTKETKGFGCAKLVVFCNAVEDNPFMAGAFHGVGEADKVISVGVSGPGVVQRAIEKVKGESFDVLAETIKKTAFKITRMGQLVAKEASERLGVPFGIVDLSLAPTPAVGDSVAHILEEMGLEVVGTHGTTAALALLNDAVKKGGVMACSHVGGLSGAFIPVSEDAGMIDAVLNGSLNLEKLEAMTAICSVGLDMIAVPGDTPAETIAAMIADESAIGMINNKTTAVRVIPAPGCEVGDLVEFGGLLGTAPVMPVNKYSSSLFIQRGGRIPAPIHSFKN